MVLVVFRDVTFQTVCYFFVLLFHFGLSQFPNPRVQFDAAGVCPRLEPEEVRNSRRIGRPRCSNSCSDHGDCTSGYKCCPLDSCKRCIQPIPLVQSKSANPMLEMTVSKDSFDKTRVQMICHGPFNPYTTLFRWYRNGAKMAEIGGIDGSRHTFRIGPKTTGTYFCSVNANVESDPNWQLSNEKVITANQKLTELKPCPRNSVRRPCGCPRTCERPICRQQCAVEGMCLCEEGLVMHQGECIPEKECPNGQGDCNGPNESYFDCGHLCTCDQFKSRKGRCGVVCGQGFICFCKPGYVRKEEGGPCISERACRSGGGGGSGEFPSISITPYNFTLSPWQQKIVDRYSKLPTFPSFPVYPVFPTFSQNTGYGHWNTNFPGFRDFEFGQDWDLLFGQRFGQEQGAGFGSTGSLTGGVSGINGRLTSTTCPPPKPIAAPPRGCYYESTRDKNGCTDFKLKCMDGITSGISDTMG